VTGLLFLACEVSCHIFVYVQESGRPEIHMAVKKVFVGGIKDGVEENDVHEYFMQYGNVESVDLVTDRETGRKRGFGFVVFDDVDAVDKIVRKCCT